VWRLAGDDCQWRLEYSWHSADILADRADGAELTADRVENPKNRFFFVRFCRTMKMP
jgi:hypothetical protein